jgi:hypothetical protein
MSSSKVKVFDRSLVITADSVTGTGPYTHTLTTATHYLQTGDMVKVWSLNTSEDQAKEVASTRIDNTNFSVSLPYKTSLVGMTIVVESYGSGITPTAQLSVSWPQQSTPGVIQVVSTGAATVAIEGSLDNTNFVNIATITLGAAGTDYFILDAAWAYIRPNITSIASTKLVKIYRSI